MDAFSLSLAYGTLNLSKKEINILSVIVGFYHFFMPIFGMLIGGYINSFLHIGEDLVILIIFGLIGINMVIESRKEQDEVKQMKLVEMLLFGLAVSVDSFSVGIGINNISSNFIMCSSIFSITSFIFTYLGLKLGKSLNTLIGKKATLIGGVVLMLLGVFNMLK